MDFIIEFIIGFCLIVGSAEILYVIISLWDAGKDFEDLDINNKKENKDEKEI